MPLSCRGTRVVSPSQGGKEQWVCPALLTVPSCPGPGLSRSGPALGRQRSHLQSEELLCASPRQPPLPAARRPGWLAGVRRTVVSAAQGTWLYFLKAGEGSWPGAGCSFPQGTIDSCAGIQPQVLEVWNVPECAGALLPAFFLSPSVTLCSESCGTPTCFPAAPGPSAFTAQTAGLTCLPERPCGALPFPSHLGL